MFEDLSADEVMAAIRAPADARVSDRYLHWDKLTGKG